MLKTNAVFDIIGFVMNCPKTGRFVRASLMLAITIPQAELAPHFQRACLLLTKACILLTKGDFA